MNIDPNYLPTIPTFVRQVIYLTYLVALLAANCIDVFYETGDPWWLPGALRVLDVVGLFIMGVVLAHTRQTPAEQIRKAEKNGEPLPAAFSVVPESRAVPIQQTTPPDLQPGELGHPQNLQPRPVTERWADEDIGPH